MVNNSTTTTMSTAATSTSTTASDILHHTSAFLSETITQPDLRHHLTALVRRKTPPNSSLKPLTLASETLENTINAANSGAPVQSSSSLRLAERILLSCRPEIAFSSFLLSLIYTLTNQPTKAALSLLNIFHLNPSLSRTELAPTIFEELFLVHLLPVLEWFNHQRSKILPSILSRSYKYGSNNDISFNDNSISGDASVVLPSNKVLSKMTGDQALELKELESCYEDVLNENCRLFAGYFKEVLECSIGGADRKVISPPAVILRVFQKGKSDDNEDHKSMRKMEEMGLKNGRYNVMLFLA